MKYKTATGNAVLKAYNLAAKKISKDKSLSSTETDAGFIIPDGQKGKRKDGYQVFVKVARFSEDLLINRPLTGGLLENQ